MNELKLLCQASAESVQRVDLEKVNDILPYSQYGFAIFSDKYIYVDGHCMDSGVVNRGTEMNELKPCPFCGGKGTICATPWDFGEKRPEENHRFIVECSECLAQTDEYETRERVVEAWNRRVE